MLHATLKSLWARKVRLLLSALSIVLGVAFVAGSLLFTNLLKNSFDALLTGAVGDVNVVAEGSSITTGGGGTSTLISQGTLDDIQNLAGIERATGVVTSYTVYPLDTDGNLVSFQGAPGIASNWHDTPAAGGETGPHIVDGREPESADEVVMDPATVERAGYAIGDEVRVSTPLGGIRTYTLVGTGTYGTGSTAGASYLFFTLAEARDIAIKGEAQYTGIWIETAEGADPQRVADEVQALVPSGFEVQTGAQIAEQTRDQLDVGLGFVNIFLLAFAGIALLVATLLILNTFQILVAQRARELALLRAVGATRGQIRRSVLVEAVLVGVVGATLGLIVGYGLAWGILAVMSATGIDLGPTVPELTWQAVVASYAIGILVTLVAALLPAARASATRPVEAMTATAQSGPEKLGVPQYVGIALIELGIAAVICATLLPVTQPLIWLGLGAAALLIGVVMAAAAVGRPVVWLFGAVFRRLFGEVGRLAQLNAVRQPRRTAATAATLMIGVALVSTVAILAASTTSSLESRLSADQRGDFIISPVAYEPFDAKVLTTVQGLDGVGKAYGYWRGSVQVGDDPDPVTLGGASRDAVVDGTNLDIVAGSLEAEGGVAPALVSSDYATDHNLAIGQLLDLKGSSGTAQVLITGLHHGGASPGLGQIVVTPETYASLTDDSLIYSIVVFTADGADTSAVHRELDKAVADLPTVAVSDVHEYTQTRIEQFSQLFGVIYALLALAIVISVLGIVNTLGLSVMERTRELGLLRAVGLTRGQLRRMVTLESVIVATLGAILGVVLGLVFGVSLVRLLADQGIEQLSIPWVELVVFVVAAALVGVLAAVGPARRAARLNVLESIAVD